MAGDETAEEPASREEAKPAEDEAPKEEAPAGEAPAEEEASKPAEEEAPLKEYPPKSTLYVEWALRRLVSTFKQRPQKFRSIGDFVDGLKPYVDKKMYKASTPEEHWEATAEALQDPALVKDRFNKFLETAGAENTKESRAYLARYKELMELAPGEQLSGGDDDESRSRSRSRSRGRQRDRSRSRSRSRSRGRRDRRRSPSSSRSRSRGRRDRGRRRRSPSSSASSR